MADDFKDGEKDRNAPTVRDLRGPKPLPSDTIPDVVGQYVPPRAPPEASRHRTIDIKPVRLSDEADPRRWRTERRLVSPERSAPRGRLAPALVTGLVLLLAFAVWALGRTRAATEGARSAASPTERPPAVSATAPLPSLTPELEELPPSVPSAAVEVEPPPVEPAPQKTPRPREAPKKRKDPWLE